MVMMWVRVMFMIMAWVRIRVRVRVGRFRVIRVRVRVSVTLIITLLTHVKINEKKNCRLTSKRNKFGKQPQHNRKDRDLSKSNEYTKTKLFDVKEFINFNCIGQ